MKERARVVEYRVDTTLLHGSAHVRWWLETDPEFGGEPDFYKAKGRCVAACQRLNDRSAGMYTVMTIALALLEEVRCANSVEVLLDGEGVAVHRDWP